MILLSEGEVLKLRAIGIGLTAVLTFCCLFFLFKLVVYRLTPLAIVSSYPARDEVGVARNSLQRITFNKSISPASVNSGTFALRDLNRATIQARVSFENFNRTVVLHPGIPLQAGTKYTITVLGGGAGVKDINGNSLPSDLVWTFTAGVPNTSALGTGPGGPVLLITSPENGFSQYYGEILRTEGFNEFASIDVSQIDEKVLAQYKIAVLGEVTLNERQLAILKQWVNSGADLIAMKPSLGLATSFGFETTSDDDASKQALGPPLSDAYLAIEAGTKAGAGLIREPIQFHGPSTEYHLKNGTVFATFYSDSKRRTPFPAISSIGFGQGVVVLYCYDLARSLIYTRQGNPKWSGKDRDGLTPIRSDDLFYGASASDPQPDWVDMRNIAIPQADIHQRLFGNIITLTLGSRMPLPHFWYLPRGMKAAIVMTGDDHGGGGTIQRFMSYEAKSPANCSVEHWECVRATSNVFVGTITADQAEEFSERGFEIGLHVYTGCSDWPSHSVLQPDRTRVTQVDRESTDALYTRQLAAFASKYPGTPAPVSNRTDCVTWGDYDTQPQVELSHGIRFDTNYYYWPAKWVQNRPGFFTGSGMPMRFAKRNGSVIDVYQAATQMTDESAQEYPYTVDVLLSNALGPREFYGVFTVNMHNDLAKSKSADAIVSAALKRHVPVVTAAQMLRWLDGRDSSSFQNLAWENGRLNFEIVVGENASGLQALLPTSSDAGTLAGLTQDGVAVPYEMRTIAGLQYAAFAARPGKMQAVYRQARTH